MLGRFGWFTENSGKQVHPPRELRPSIRGAFDMHGNLLEWTHDWYNSEFGSAALTDPIGPSRGSRRVSRGGSWVSGAATCRAAYRSTGGPAGRMYDFGFRLALSPIGVASPAEQEQEKEVAELAGAGTEGASAEQRPEMP